MNKRIILQDLPTGIKGFVQKKDDYYTIVLNSRMSFEKNQESYLDEIDHIDHQAFDSDEPVDQIELKSHRRQLGVDAR